MACADDLLRRGLERLQAAAGAVLDHHLEAAAGADAATGGGGMVKMKASWIDRELAGSARPGCAAAVKPFGSRSSKGSKAEKIAPALEALVKVAPSKPAKGTACSTPSVSEDDACVACFTTASVRASEAPGGSWMTVIR